MKRLCDLIPNAPDILINDIKINSKEVKPNDIFVCVTGVTADRNLYIDEAINNGAICVVTSKKVDISCFLVIVDNPDEHLFTLCQKLYDYDSSLTLIATTGTNGKTTVASLISSMIGNDVCGYLGTNGMECSKFHYDIKNTTPSIDRLFKYFKMFKDASIKYVSMEASSEAFLRKRLKGISFDIGILTDITSDHLNAHGSLKNYISCKKELFKNIKDNGYAILNADSKYYDEFRKCSKGTILTYGKKKSDLQIIDYKLYLDYTYIKLKYKNKIYEIKSPLLGEFNIYNLCSAILTLVALNYEFSDIMSRIKNIILPKGRVELIDYGQKYKIILDYAHNTDALEKLYSFLKSVGDYRIISVTGSAGGRDIDKRKYMGKVVLDNSFYTIFTMDDPRYEDVNKIIDDLVSISDKTNYERIIDRKTAIKRAFDIALENDIVLILGKGHANYMAIKDEYLPYNDFDVIRDYFNK